MPFMTVRLAAPGVKALQTPTMLTANIVASQNIRWRGGLPEKLGGWAAFFAFAIPGIIRELWAWEDLNSQTHLGEAGDGGASVITNNGQTDVTPIFSYTQPSVSFSTTAGSSLVTINDPGSNVTTFQSITLQCPVAVGGIVILPGNYSIVSVQSVDQYTINCGQAALASVTNAGATATLTPTTGSPNIVIALANHGLSVGSTFTIALGTTVGGIALYGFYPVSAVEAPPTATASAAFTSGSTFTVSVAPTGTIPVGTVITDTNTGLIVGTFASIAGTTVTIQQANPINHVANGDGLSFASGTFTIIGYMQANSSTMVYYANLAGAIQIAHWEVITPQPAGGGWGDGPWGGFVPSSGGTTAWGQSPAPPPITGTRVTAPDWCLENWGSQLIINPEDWGLFHWNPASGLQQSQLIVAAPTYVHGFFIAMPQQQIVAYGATTNGVQDPMLIAWCDTGNFNTWTAAVNNQAGTYRLTRGSRIVGGIQGPMQSMLWTDVGLWIMQYIGYPDVWGFNEIARGCGLIAKKAVAVVLTQVFWMSLDGFWVYAGGGAQRLPCDVWDVVKNNLNTAYLSHIRAAANTAFDEVAWYFPSMASTGENDTYIKFNTVTGEWDYGSLAVSEWIDQNVFGGPISAMPDDTGANSIIMQHEASADANGSPLVYSMTTGYFQLAEGEQFVFADYAIPDGKWKRFADPPSTSATIQVTFFVQDFPDDDTKPPVAIGPAFVNNESDAIDIRCRGRYLSLQIMGNDIGSFFRLGGFKIRFAPDGRNS